MQDKSTVVGFPKVPKMRRDKTDADHVANVMRAWKALARAIADAQNFGLEVDTGDRINFHATPRISRHYRAK